MSLCRWPEATRLVEQGRPDVLLMEASPRNTTAWTLPLRCRKLGIPTLAWSKVHGYSALAPVMRLLKPSFYARFDRVICYGESGSRELVNLGYPADRVDVAHNTIDTRRIFLQGDEIRRRASFLCGERGLADRRILLCIGRMDPEKRHRDLLGAWPRLRALDDRLVLVLVGGGRLLEQVRAEAAALDSDRILVTGRVPEGDDYAWIAASELCVFPGAIGLAINQSLALGKPTVIADEPGSDSEFLVGHGPRQTGWRYPRGNRSELVRAVEQVLRAPAEAAEVCERARALLRDTVNLENMVGAVDASIQKALRLRRAPESHP